MSLLCAECNSDLRDGYQILILVGHSKTGLVKPEESPVRTIICNGHIAPGHMIDKLAPFEQSNVLVFALVEGSLKRGGNFNGNFSSDDEYRLKTSGYFDRVKYVQGRVIAQCLPDTFNNLAETIASMEMEGELQPFKIALERYLENRAQYARTH